MIGKNRYAPRVGNNRKKPDPEKKRVRQRMSEESRRRNRRA